MNAQIQNTNIGITTAYGHIVDFNQPEKTTVDLRDLRTATSNICRYVGHANWKLVQHLALCTKLAQTQNFDPLTIAHCAAHDLHEAYVGDVATGLKILLPAYKTIEDRFEIHVLSSLGLPTVLVPERIKHIDYKALALEMKMLRHPGLKNLHPSLPRYFSPEDEQTFYSIARNTLAENWNIVETAIITGRKYGQSQNRT